ncbi:MAG: chromate transporter [Candidatus Roseilinea sp.]|nr:MAG: chromate transporter [Candidatus Roseilinea sp.]
MQSVDTEAQHAILRRQALLRIAAYFTRLGFIGFGGPPAHIALMRADLVDRRRWVSAEQFNDDLSVANLLPGPTSTEMAIYLGHRLGGVAGAIIAGVCFILPAFFIVLALSVIYVNLGTLDVIEEMLYGVKPVALALIISGTVQLGRPMLTGWREWLLLFLSIAAVLSGQLDVLLLFVLAGLALLIISGAWRSLAPLGTALPAESVAQFTLLTTSTDPGLLAQVFLHFLKIGAVIYGGGFALVGILQQEVVRNLGWITQEQLLDGIALGQSTPGPVFTTATFVGYLVAGLPGAVLATIGIFTPAFVFVVLERRFLGHLRTHRSVQRFLCGVNIAVVATITVAAAQLSHSALVDWVTVGIGLASLVALRRFKLDAAWLVGAGLVVGVIRWLGF